MKALLLLVACVLVANSVKALEWRAAKEWGQLSHDAKVYYMNGVFDGIVLAPSLFQSEKEAAQVKHAIGEAFKGMDAAGAVHALDWFYQTKQNRNIPIGAAVFYLALAGHSELRAQAEQVLGEMRRKSR